ncbi:hypothetical protein ACKWTF_006636 [Chironomus riparius]
MRIALLTFLQISNVKIVYFDKLKSEMSSLHKSIYSYFNATLFLSAKYFYFFLKKRSNFNLLTNKYLDLCWKLENLSIFDLNLCRLGLLVEALEYFGGFANYYRLTISKYHQKGAVDQDEFEIVISLIILISFLTSATCTSFVSSVD